MRSFVVLFVACALRALAGCAGGGADTAAVEAANLAADDVREDCVTRTLSVLQIAADLCAALPDLRDADALEAHAAREGCRVEGPDADGVYTLICTTRLVDNETLGLRLLVRYVRDGLASVASNDVERVEVTVNAGTNFMTCNGRLDFVSDADRGTLIEGVLDSQYFTGCTLHLIGEDIAANMVADLPSGRNGAVFAAGHLDLALTFETRADVTGSAALIGRRAVIALHMDGVATTGEVVLDP